MVVSSVALPPLRAACQAASSTGRRRPSLRLTDTARIEAFSDGVFAIAITLLVLDLHTSASAGRVSHHLLRQWPSYLAVLLAASVLPFPTAQLAFAMREGTDSDRLAVLILYSIVSTAMGAAWLIYHRLHRHPELIETDVPTRFFRRERLRAIGGLIAQSAPVVIGLISPVAAIGIIVLTPIFYALTAEGLPSPA